MGGVGGGAAIGGISGVQMQDGGPGLCRADGGGGDLVSRHRQVGRLAGHMDRAGDGAGDDDFGHGASTGESGMAGEAMQRAGRWEDCGPRGRER